LLASIIPTVCKLRPDVYFIIGGDGPKRRELEAMINCHELHSRVELLGSVPPSEVPAMLTRGQIFLSTSLTEAYCIAVLEAVSCGLLGISTRVGGVAEIFPPHVLQLAEPEEMALVSSILKAVEHVQGDGPRSYHDYVASRHSWVAVASATALVYDEITADASPTCAPRGQIIWKQLVAGLNGGALALVVSLLSTVLIAVQATFLCLLSAPGMSTNLIFAEYSRHAPKCGGQGHPISSLSLGSPLLKGKGIVL